MAWSTQSDCFSVEPLKYRDPHGGSSTSLILFAGVIAIMLVMLTTPQAQKAYVPCSSVARNVASMAVKVITSKANLERVDADEVETPVAEEVKAKNELKVRRWLANPKHAKGIILIFAHWCPHCKSTLPIMEEMAKSHKDVSFLMINAEACPQTLFSGSDAVHALEYFPTILAKVGAMARPVESVQEGIEAVSTETVVEEEAEVTEGPSAAWETSWE